MEGETPLGAKNRKKLEGIDSYFSKEECPHCGETKVYYTEWDKPICPKCGAELPKLNNKEKGGKIK